MPKVKITIDELNQEKDDLEPKYDEVVNQSEIYEKKLNDLEKEMELKGEFDPSSHESRIELLNQFEEKHPDYERFMDEYKQVTSDFRNLNMDIANNNKILKNIESYKRKVQAYFSEK